MNVKAMAKMELSDLLQGDILHHSNCDICVWGETGFYNAICCHCKYVTFSKSNEPRFMTRDVAERLGLVLKK